MTTVPAHLRQPANARTLFDTACRADAIAAGYDGAREPANDGEGFRVVFKGSGSIPVLEIIGPEGCVEIPGWAAIAELRLAVASASELARRMEGRK